MPNNDRKTAFRILLVVAGALTVFLVCAEKPWDHAEKIAARIAEGKDPTLKQDILVGLYRAAILNLGLCAALLAGIRLWTRPPGTTPREATEPRPENRRVGSGKRFFLLLTLAVVLGGALRWNLAHRSLWWDELWNAKRTFHGSFETGPDGERSFRPHSFQRALWYYKKPTNHVPFAVSSRLCLEAWQVATGRNPREFDEFVLRLPSYLAALGAIAGIAVLLRTWGMPGAGILAAFLLAIHPWHIRYGIDGRSYSLAILFTVLAAIALTLALRHGHWRHWLAFGFCQFLLVWSNPLLAFLAAGFAGGALLHIVLSRNGDRKRDAIARLVVTNVLAAMLFLQIMAPNLVQAQRWDMSPGAFEALGRENFLEYLSQQSFGFPFRYPDNTASQGLPTLATRTAGSTAIQAGLGLAAGLLFLGGIITLFRRNREAFAVTASIVAASVVYLAVVSRVESFYFYPRFLSYGLVPYLACLAAGLCALGSRLNRRWGTPAVILGTTIAAALFVLPQIRMFWNRPYEPCRDITSFIREQAPRSISVIYGHGGEHVDLYDPDIRFVTETGKLVDLCEESRRTGLPLFLACGHNGFNRSRLPGAFELIDNTSYFTPVREFAGIEPEFFYRVFHYTGARIPGMTP